MRRHAIHSISERFDKDRDYFEADRSELLSLLPKPPSRVLDLGCGTGRTWADHPAEVHGIERSEEAAAEARSVLQAVHVGDIETIDLPFPDGHFDCIVAADVLEHLRDPWGALLRYRRLLGGDGHLLTSIPNVRYYRVLQPLLFRADFAYEREGVLDIDHLRFFARRNARGLIEATGFEVVHWKDHRRGSPWQRLVNRLLLGALNDFLTKQFLICARTAGGGRPDGTTPTTR